MRVPSSLDYRWLSSGLDALRGEEARQLAQAASGRRIRKPSDDPVGSARAAEIRGELARLGAAAAASTHASAQLKAADDALAAMGDIVAMAAEQGARGASDLVPGAGRRALAESIRQAADSLLAAGNRTLAGRSLFAGARTMTPAFTRAGDGSFVYQGDDRVRELSILGSRVGLNRPGDEILTGAVNAGTALETLAGAVEASDVDGTVNALGQVEALRRQIGEARLKLGIGSARLEELGQELRGETLRARERLSDLEDADLVEVASELGRLRLYLEATLGAAGSRERRTLFDVLT